MKKMSRAVEAQTIEAAERFFADNRQAIADYAESAGLVFAPGERWSIDMAAGRGTYEPVFFTRRGFTAAESMWAVCHEIEHFRDWRADPEAYAALYKRIGRGAGDSTSSTTRSTTSSRTARKTAGSRPTSKRAPCFTRGG